MAAVEDFAPAAETAPVPVPAHPDPSLFSSPQAPSSSSLPAHQVTCSISPDAWSLAESAAAAVVSKTQPTFYSECLRFGIIRYLNGLIRRRVGCEVLPFGSVPLKTYLPNGDIDLTAFSPSISDENLASEIHTILLSEENRKDAEFEVRDVQFICAKVKLVRCLVQNIAVDISFNQIGGLHTLCFLEKVDQLFGKGHLFKRSIILIKSWFYYEGRILGAKIGLLLLMPWRHWYFAFSIFSTSHWMVLYRFLDYYSKFDWDNKGISLFGPISLSALPELVTDPLDTLDEDSIQRKLFDIAKKYGVPTRNSEDSASVFSRKFLNIVDPLKRNNNLGRSVSKGNFCRIRLAFGLGARKLGKNLQGPASSIGNEMNQFFRTTLKKNPTGLRPDVLDNAQHGGAACDFASDLNGALHWSNFMHVQQYHLDYPTNQVYYQMPNPPPAQYQNTRSSNGRDRKNAYGYAGPDGVIPGPIDSQSYVSFRPYFQTGLPTAMRDNQIGTYFPYPIIFAGIGHPQNFGKGEGTIFHGIIIKAMTEVTPLNSLLEMAKCGDQGITRCVCVCWRNAEARDTCIKGLWEQGSPGEIPGGATQWKDIWW
ncbi:hypothetical protein ACP4OV_003606 [Aristida adscensionis]